MRSCRLEIFTETDGKENRIVRSGEILLAPAMKKLRYFEENARVEIVLRNAVVEVFREGDYSMFLRLEKGAITDGTIGIGGQTGDVRTKTTRVAYAINENSLLLSLHYDLLIGGEKQAMKLRIFAQYNSAGEDES